MRQPPTLPCTQLRKAAGGRRRQRRRFGGFTLIEVLIVTTLLAILASVLIPTIARDSDDAELVALKHNETLLNKVIGTYRMQHNKPPDVNSGAMPQLFAATNSAGVIGSGAGYTYGPYLAGTQLPINPRTDSRIVTEVAQMPPAAYQGGGWLYHKASSQIMADGTPGDPVEAVDSLEAAGL